MTASTKARLARFLSEGGRWITAHVSRGTLETETGNGATAKELTRHHSPRLMKMASFRLRAVVINRLSRTARLPRELRKGPPTF